MAKRRVNDKQLIVAIRRSYGNVTAAADALGYDPSTIRRRVNKSKKLQAVLLEAREQVVDIAETKRLELIYSGDWRAIEHALRTWGSKRGHNAKMEITGADGGPIKFIEEKIGQDRMNLLRKNGDSDEEILLMLLESLAAGIINELNEDAL